VTSEKSRSGLVVSTEPVSLYDLSRRWHVMQRRVPDGSGRASLACQPHAASSAQVLSAALIAADLYY
jgi:hypothetical protein